MDIQLKKGLLEVCVLASLMQEDSYGYQLISDLSSCVEISESTLYPILKRLDAPSALPPIPGNTTEGCGSITALPLRESSGFRNF